MIAVTVTYILGEPKIALGQFIPMNVAYIIGGVVAFIILAFYFFFLFKLRVLKKEEEPQTT